MTATIIKAAGAPSPAVPIGWETPAARIDPELIRLRSKIKSLEAQLAARDETVRQLEAATAEAHAQGSAEGQQAATVAFEDREQDRLELLAQGIAQAVADCASTLADSERLAALIACECLDRMLGAAAARTELIHDLIRHQYAQLDAQSILAVRVSPADFSEVGALRLAHDGTAKCNLQRDDRLTPGAVQIDLTLGMISAGIDQQWGSFRTVLADLAGMDG